MKKYTPISDKIQKGFRFGMLTVLETYTPNPKTEVKLVCDCGKQIVKRVSTLLYSPYGQSCGCQRLQNMKNTVKERRSGMTKRSCLKCGSSFLSENRANRVCQKCKSNESWKNAEL